MCALSSDRRVVLSSWKSRLPCATIVFVGKCCRSCLPFLTQQLSSSYDNRFSTVHSLRRRSAASPKRRFIRCDRECESEPIEMAQPASIAFSSNSNGKSNREGKQLSSTATLQAAHFLNTSVQSTFAG